MPWIFGLKADIFWNDYQVVYFKALARGVVKQSDKVVPLDLHAKAVLYYVAGWVFHSLFNCGKQPGGLDSEHIAALKEHMMSLEEAKNSNDDLPLIVVQRSKYANSGVCVSQQVLDLFLKVEHVCRGFTHLDTIRISRNLLMEIILENVIQDDEILSMAGMLIGSEIRRRKQSKNSKVTKTAQAKIDDTKRIHQTIVQVLMSKFLGTRIKAAMRFLMNEMDVTEGTEIRKELKALASKVKTEHE